ncbi:hypothetical protein B9G54_02655 [Alloscardovia macacae]|uniref:bifunctional riboflavin kinase/FMN adenylyltransferase n=1 Tax=Alloscardovia macacae TaxID=1160091 RepID=UPI000A2E69AC|nr:riboflavin kinase [Alloscardovia macacae]OTA26948.1 hypothetical protein B9G54_02655 [Alloscardovia macacae]
MEILRLEPDEQGIVAWPTLSEDKRAVVTIGSFDGVHRGHQAVLARAVELAHTHDVPSVAITFDPRPGVVHAGIERDTQAVMSLDQRLELMDQAGFDYALVVRYTLAFAARTYIFFLGQLVGKLGMRTLVLGSDATMGKGREGDIAAIRKLSGATGVFELDVVDDFGPAGIYLPREVQYVVPEAGYEGANGLESGVKSGIESGMKSEPSNPLTGMTKAQLRAWSKKQRSVAVREYSSSMVRFLLARGCVRDAAEILGRAHSIDATVVHGQARGRELGFPTANMADIRGFVPVDGVYAGYLTVLGSGERSGERYAAAISVGVNSTFEQDGARFVEVYCLDVPEGFDIYNASVRVEFVSYLRPMVAFEGAEALVEQMKRDVDTAREALEA